MDQPLHDLIRRVDQLTAQFQDLREGIKQAIVIAELDPEMSLTRARKVLESMVRQVYERRINEPAGTLVLFDTHGLHRPEVPKQERLV